MKSVIFFVLGLMSLHSAWAQPSQEWLSYFSGTFTRVTNIVHDAQQDCIYIAGITGDTFGIATEGALKEDFVHGITDSTYTTEYDLFLARFDLDGNLVWSTYWGGLESERIPVMNVDRSGNIYLAGRSPSAGLATADAHLDTPGLCLLSKFSPDGHLLWSTYFLQYDSIEIDGTMYWRGGDIFSIEFDGNNNVYLSGQIGTNIGLGTPGVHKPEVNTPGVTDFGFAFIIDAFLAKFDSTGQQLWGTYYGGGGLDYGMSLAVTDSGFCYLVGITKSDTGIALNSLYQDSLIEGSYLAKFDPNGQLVWGTYLNYVTAMGVVEDRFGDVYVYGHTSSSIGVSTFGDTLSGTSDCFLMKFNAAGEQIWGRYLGGAGRESVLFATGGFFAPKKTLVYDELSDHLYVAADILDIVSPGDWATECSYPTQFDNKGALAKLNLDGDVVWTSHYDEQIFAIEIRQDNSVANDIFIAGYTLISGLATDGAHLEEKYPWRYSGFLGKFKDIYSCTDSFHLSMDDSYVLQTDTGFSDYQWYLNGELIDGADSASLVAVVDGNYKVTATKCDCFYADSLEVALGIFEQGNLNISIRPNPVTDKIWIDNAGQYFLENVQVLDMYGRVVQQQVIQSRLDQYSVSTEDLPAGTYILHVHTDNGFLKKKFTKL